MNPTTQQRSVIESNEKSILCVAGPGSGKTSTLIARINRLINEDNAPQSMVIITFTNAAAREIKTRFEKLVGAAWFGYVGTLHGFCLKLLTEFGEMMGYGSNVSVLDEEQAAELLADEAKVLRFKGSTKELLELKKNGPVDTKDHRLTAAELVINTYFNRLRRTGTLDFDMLLFEALRLIHSDAATLMNWRYLFVDEFQDSGNVDYQIYKSLPIPTKFFVGDPDQSIYAFRGGNVGNILEFAKESKVYTLTENFRCPALICGYADALIANNKDRIAKRMVAAKKGIADDTLPANALVPIVGKSVYKTDGKEAAEIMASIESAIATGVSPEQIAVLCRTNHLALTLAKIAEGRGIEVKKKPESKFPRDWQHARLTLEMLINPLNDMVAAFWIKASQGPEVAANAKTFAALHQCNIMDSFKYKGARITAATIKDYTTKLARLDVSLESIELLQSREAEIVHPTLLDLTFALARDYEQRNEVGHGVTFTTIHSSKGREWPLVFMPGLEQETIPGKRKDLNLEEERRILFVGLTRSKRWLRLSHAQTRVPAFGSPRPVPVCPSQFWREMGLI